VPETGIFATGVTGSGSCSSNSLLASVESSLKDARVGGGVTGGTVGSVDDDEPQAASVRGSKEKITARPTVNTSTFRILTLLNLPFACHRSAHTALHQLTMRERFTEDSLLSNDRFTPKQ
jgi:hypothetical protein